MLEVTGIIRSRAVLRVDFDLNWSSFCSAHPTNQFASAGSQVVFSVFNFVCLLFQYFVV